MALENLITDRSASDVSRLRYLISKGWANMTEAERNEYLASIGAYNATDINRVSEAEQYLAELANSFVEVLRTYLDAAKQSILGNLTFDAAYYTLTNPLLPDALAELAYATPVPMGSVKTDWGIEDRPAFFTDETERIYDISYYLTNLATLRGLLPVNAPDVPTDFWNNATTAKANSIEQILIIVYNALLAYEAQKKTAIDTAEQAETMRYELTARSWITANEAYAGEF